MMHIHARCNPAKFHHDRIWNDRALGLSGSSHPDKEQELEEQDK